MSELLSSPTIRFCLVLFTSGLLWGVLTGRIEFQSPFGTFGGGNKNK